MTFAQIQVRPNPSALPALQRRGAWEGPRDWRTLAHVNAGDRDALERQMNELHARAPSALYEYRVKTRAPNPPAHLHIPPATAQLGTVLDLTTQSDAQRTLWESADVGGMLMCADADAMQRRPGAAALYLLRGPSEAGGKKTDDTDDAEETYERWHKREPKNVRQLDGLPDLIGVYIGRACRIGYRSDKWHDRGDHEDYDHDYTEPGYEMPEVWADRVDLGQARAIVIVGGNQRITEEGID